MFTRINDKARYVLEHVLDRIPNAIIAWEKVLDCLSLVLPVLLSVMKLTKLLSRCFSSKAVGYL